MPESAALFISCTNLRTVEIIDRLEKELRVPVVSSNTATLWAGMKVLGVEQKMKGYGKVFESMELISPTNVYK